jgi:hypothetical protein
VPVAFSKTILGGVPMIASMSATVVGVRMRTDPHALGRLVLANPAALDPHSASFPGRHAG